MPTVVNETTAGTPTRLSGPPWHHIERVPDHMRIYAHRGVSAHYPENTLAAFERAIGLGIDGVELDVHLAGDGIPVVIHDGTVDRTTNGIGAVSDFTAKQLGLLDAGHRQHVPTLDAVLGMSAGKVRVNIELKDAAAVGPVLKVVSAHRGLDWFASSSDWGTLAAIARQAPGTDCYPTTLGVAVNPDGQGTLQDAVDFAAKLRGTGVSVWGGCLDRAAVESIHARGLEVWAWTVNDPARAKELEDLGVDALCTDDPLLIRNALSPRPLTVPVAR